MTGPRKFPFGGVPIYNPQSLSKREALAQFHARQAGYQSLVDLLHEERPPHVLIIGTRGMGKTTLLQRIRYGIEDDARLNRRYLPLIFSEEQYNVNHLHHFFLNTVDALADAMERLRNEKMLARVEAYADVICKLDAEEIEERVPKFLAEFGQDIQRSFVLLVDNADRLFDTIEDREQWRLRELLSNRPDLTLFGATTQASEGIYGSNRAFFEFFKIHRLTSLTFEEVKDLLLQLSESVEEKDGEKGAAKRRMKDWLAADAARLRALVQLTGGNPRTTVLLFHLVLDGLGGGAREYLEQLLDQCTPTYKGRVDELPPQAQQVLDAVALKWDPVTAMEVAEATGLETNVVSTQLTRLQRQGLLEKADPGDSKKALYQVAERFFNIWYLMRASRRVRAKLRWFVEFLRVFFDSGELEHMAWHRLHCFRGSGWNSSGELETTFAYALASGADCDKFENYLREEYPAWEADLRPYLELLRGGDAQLAERRLTSKKQPVWLSSGELEMLQNAAEIARRGEVNPEVRQTLVKAEAKLRRMVEIDPMRSIQWARLGGLIALGGERFEEAEEALRKAIEVDPKLGLAWTGLGCLIAIRPERFEEAETNLRKAIEIDPTLSYAWDALGSLLALRQERLEEAEMAFRKAIEIDPTLGVAWTGLGSLLALRPERFDEAETAFRKAIEIEPRSATPWQKLGVLLANNEPGRLDEAEAAIRKSVDLDPRSAWSWKLLGNLIGKSAHRNGEAENALKRAVDIAPDMAPNWTSLGFHFACRAGKPVEAEIALRKAVELKPNNPSFLQNLGVLLYAELQREKEAVSYLRQASQLDPENAVSAAILSACVRKVEGEADHIGKFNNDAYRSAFWDELIRLCENYPPFGKILIGICDLVLERDGSNALARLHRAVALAQLGDFPRASVALDDALSGDPIEQLSVGRKALEVFLAAAVRAKRIRDCIEIIDKKEWKDAWRPIYEALQAAELGTSEYLKRVAVEIRDPAMTILKRIAPGLG